MKLFKLTFLLVILLSTASITGFAANPEDGDNLYVFTKSASNAVVYSLDDIEKMTFDDHAFNVWVNGGKTDYAYGNISLLTFRGTMQPVTSVESLTTPEESEIQVAFNRATLLVSAESRNALSSLMVCDLQGRTLATLSKNAAKLQLSLAHMPQGVYIVKAQGAGTEKSVKIIK